MSFYTFTDPESGRSFKVTGGTGITEAQARQIFDSQAQAGSLVGLKAGQKLDAASQAAAGLASARSSVAQELAQLSGAGQAAAGLNSLNSVASSTLKNIDSAISKTPVTNGIGIADYSLTAPLNVNIGSVSPQQVKATLAQAEKLVGQDYSLVTDAKGLGKYGLDVPQLEAAGLVKSGTTAKFIDTGLGTTADVLKSPTVWTGKSGVNAQADILSSVTKQDIVQTGLMVAGVAGLATQGVPTGAMNAAALAGTALVAAKGVENALAWAQNKDIGSDLTSQFNQLAKDGAFAAGFADSKISDAMALEFPALPAIDTADRATLNAAATRVVGNPKIPSLNFSVSAIPGPGELTAQLNEIFATVSEARSDAGIIAGQIGRARMPDDLIFLYQRIEEAENLLADLEAAKSQALSLRRQAEAADPPNTAIVSNIESLQIDVVIAQLEGAVAQARQKTAAYSSA